MREIILEANGCHDCDATMITMVGIFCSITGAKVNDNIDKHSFDEKCKMTEVEN